MDPEVDLLALSDDNEYFFSLTNEQWDKCNKLEYCKLCKIDQPIQHQVNSNMCVVLSLTNQPNLPETCELKFVSIDTLILHRLPQTNSWLYYTSQPLGDTIVCLEPPKKIKIKISGVGRISIFPTCELHMGNFILLPINSINRDVKLDIIPENPTNHILTTLTETLKFTLPQKDLIKNLNTLVKTADKIGELTRIFPEPMFIFKIGFHL